MAEKGKQHFTLYITPSVRAILMDISEEWEC